MSHGATPDRSSKATPSLWGSTLRSSTQRVSIFVDIWMMIAPFLLPLALYYVPQAWPRLLPSTRKQPRHHHRQRPHTVSQRFAFPCAARPRGWPSAPCLQRSVRVHQNHQAHLQLPSQQVPLNSYTFSVLYPYIVGTTVICVSRSPIVGGAPARPTMTVTMEESHMPARRTLTDREMEMIMLGGAEP